MRLILPSFFALSMLHVVLPFAYIARAVCRSINSFSMGFIIQPESFIIIAISMPVFSFTVSFVVKPLSFILVSILKPFYSISSSLSLFVYIACIYTSYILRKSYFLNILKPFCFYHILKTGVIFIRIPCLLA